MDTPPTEDPQHTDLQAEPPNDALDTPEEGEEAGEEEVSEEESILAEEAALGSTPAGTATNAALRALSRAARSFLLYDPSNDAIRVFLQDYQEATAAALEHGPIELTMRPFEMLQGSEIVYLERDRERSLAFRMFRDGVRRLTINPAVEWSELLRLLEILSIRYTGVRQQEDDIVTLLWKAGFTNIEIAAVEGFVPDDDEDDADSAAARMARANRQADSHMEVPRDWDQPLPDLGTQTMALRYVSIAPAALEAIQQEDTSAAIADNALRLVEQMLLVVADITDPTTFMDIYPLIQEVRDFLLAEGQLDTLTQLASSMRAFFSDSEESEDVLKTFINERALRRIIRSTSKGSDEVPPILFELLDLVSSDHLTHLIAILQTERATSSRTMIRKLITHYTRNRAQYLIDHIPTTEAGVARDLLIALAEAAPARTLDAVELAAERSDTELQYEILRVLKQIPRHERSRVVLFGLLDAPSEDIRTQALEQLISFRDAGLYAELVHYVEKHAPSRLQQAEASLIGRTLVELNPKAAQRLLAGWIRPHGMLRRLGAVPGQNMLRWTAVAGIGRLDGDRNEELIRWMAKQAGEDLRKHCMHTLYLRRKERLING